MILVEPWIWSLSSPNISDISISVCALAQYGKILNAAMAAINFVFIIIELKNYEVGLEEAFINLIESEGGNKDVGNN